MVHLNRHARRMKSMREENTLAEHALVASREFDFGDCESMSQMQRAVHVREREGSKPFGELFSDFSRRETSNLLARWRLDLKHALFRPLRLVLFLQVDQKVALARLPD